VYGFRLLNPDNKLAGKWTIVPLYDSNVKAGFGEFCSFQTFMAKLPEVPRDVPIELEFPELAIATNIFPDFSLKNFWKSLHGLSTDQNCVEISPRRRLILNP
jgi:hypothetical protein